MPEGEKILDFFDPWYLAKNNDDIEGALKEFEETAKMYEFGGENIPQFFPNFGPGIMAAVFGIEPKYQSRTVWFHQKTDIGDIVSHLEGIKLNSNNHWYARLKRVTEIAAKHAKTNYSVSITDIGGVLDVLSSFLGPTQIILTMRKNSGLIDACRSIILEKLLQAYDELQSILFQHGDGMGSWMHLWFSKRWYPIQCDFSAFLNPKYFKRFALPDIIAQADHMDRAIYHLDGPNALPHLDELLKVPSITGIQWVPGAGKELYCSDAWMPVYKKIQAAGKNVVMDFFELPERLTHFYNTLNPKQLFTLTIFSDKARALFNLPKFLGGNGGEGNYRQFKKEYRKKAKGEASAD